MSYTTNSELQRWLGPAIYLELTDDENEGVADDNRATEARLGAEGEVNSYLATRYAVPVELSAAPEAAALLRAVVLDLAAYRLHSRRPPVPPDLVRRREEVVTWLSRLAAGQAQLPVTAAPAENAALGLLGRAAGSERVFTRADLENC